MDWEDIKTIYSQYDDPSFWEWLEANLDPNIPRYFEMTSPNPLLNYRNWLEKRLDKWWGAWQEYQGQLAEYQATYSQGGPELPMEWQLDDGTSMPAKWFLIQREDGSYYHIPLLPLELATKENVQMLMEGVYGTDFWATPGQKDLGEIYQTSVNISLRDIIMSGGVSPDSFTDESDDLISEYAKQCSAAGQCVNIPAAINKVAYSCGQRQQAPAQRQPTEYGAGYREAPEWNHRLTEDPYPWQPSVQERFPQTAPGQPLATEKVVRDAQGKVLGYYVTGQASQMANIESVNQARRQEAETMGGIYGQQPFTPYRAITPEKYQEISKAESWQALPQEHHALSALESWLPSNDPRVIAAREALRKVYEAPKKKYMREQEMKRQAQPVEEWRRLVGQSKQRIVTL